MSALSTKPTRGEDAATTSTARLITDITSSHSPSMLVNMALVSLGRPEARTTRTASATASLTPPRSSPSDGLMLKATSMVSALQQATEDVLHDPAVPVVVRLTGRVDSDDRVELRVPGLHLHSSGRLAGIQGGHPSDRERLLTGQPEGLGVLSLGVLQREHAHADQVRAVDPLVGLRDDRLDAEQRRALGGPVAR